LHQQKGAEVSVLTKLRYKEVLEGNHNVSNIYAWDTGANQELLSKLKNLKFDYVIDLQNSLRSGRIRIQLKGRKLTLNKKVKNKFLLHNFGINRYNGIHILDDYLSCIQEIEIENDGLGLDFFISNEWEDIGKTGLMPTIAIVSGGTYMTKRIPEQLILDIVRDSNYQYCILGGDDVSDVVLAISGDHIFNGVGKLELKESAYRIRDADIVITGDTGLMHIAAAFQKPIVVIWGSTTEEIGFYPYYGSQSKQRFISIRDISLSCQPCSKYGRPRCPKGHMNCLNHIFSDEVMRAVQELLR